MLRRFPSAVPVVALVVGLLLGLPSPSSAASSSSSSAGTPALEGPVDGARIESLPVFTWKPAARAEQYQFQLAADRQFAGVVLGTGPGSGSFRTRNTAATVHKTIPDGTYWWRVRAFTKADRPGRWSAPRRLEKRWDTAPELLGPDGLAAPWPASPTVLRWAPVPGAAGYLVTLAGDQDLAAPVLGTAREPLRTRGTSVALPGVLSVGRWWWAVTPVDAQGHRGTRSRVAAFDFDWPSTTRTQVGDLPADPAAPRPAWAPAGVEPQVHHPILAWAPVAGAASYQVEVNQSEDWAPASRWCCDEPTTGTSITPVRVLANNRWFWRVRPLDVRGNAGQWTTGTPFVKAFYPEVRGLALRERVDGPALPPGSATARPLVTWDPVPGAASYEVQNALFKPAIGGCDWSDVTTTTTATAAWSPTKKTIETKIGPEAWPNARNPKDDLLPGMDVCLRVAAYTDDDARSGKVVSPFSYLGAGAFAFRFAGHDPGPVPPSGLQAKAGDYHRVTDVAGADSDPERISPFFSWEHVPGARGYYVVIARDEAFTKVVDVAYTLAPVYAPRTRPGGVPLTDESSDLFWAVMPTSSGDGRGLTTQPGQNAPRAFRKVSVPPEPLGPGGGTTVSDQPQFLWAPATHSLEHRLQVATDERFSKLLEDRVVAGTSFTSAATYPADQTLFWRVRANDVNEAGLSWSRTETFRRALPAPAPDPGVALAGEQLPVLSWSPVAGASSYEIHVEQADGTTKTFPTQQTAFTPTAFYGTGIWRWRTRALFPGQLGRQPAASAWSESRTFTRVIRPPTGARGSFAGGRLLLQWNPDTAADRFRVELATSDGFERPIAFAQVDHPAWAPDLRSMALRRGGTLWWRVAAMDAGDNVGAWTIGTLKLPRTLQVSARKAPLQGTRGPVVLRVADAAGAPLKGVRLLLRGAGIGKPRRLVTGRDGTARATVRPRTRGPLLVEARRKGFQTSKARVQIRRRSVK